MNFNAKPNIYRGHRGKKLKKAILSNKNSTVELIDEEIKSICQKKEQFDPSKCKHFSEFPISSNTLKGLLACKYDKPTDIQREAISVALNGHDLLGAAKTGSGKTLAFIVPVLERLFHKKWSSISGLGALIISPTRELAFQTFEVLKKVGRFHDFSAGLVIGGNPLKEEAGRINKTNIVICTPGRLLQHMDETTYFVADSLKILVLDEADRILDLGFAQTMNAILENLPLKRQTLLFSATQTRSVNDLARLSLKKPVYVSVHENAPESTPTQLDQSYVVCELHDKMNILWSFLKDHIRSKILIFVSSCKQVRYIHEAMKRLQPGIPVLGLHGGMPQFRRVEVYNQFVAKQRACLFATDIASRGLDFPSVNWVMQLDCPEDANTYIHRVGRTARFEKDGQSCLILLPSEESGIVKLLEDKKIPIDKIRVNPKKQYSIQPKLESLCASEPAFKEMAQRAFKAYLKSVFLMKNKNVFDVKALDIENFAKSLGLAFAPKVRFLKTNMTKVSKKNVELSSVNEGFVKNTKSCKVDNQELSSSESDSEISDDDESAAKYDSNASRADDVIDIFTVKKDNTVISNLLESEEDNEDIVESSSKKSKKNKNSTKYADAKKVLRKKLKVNTKVVFDDEGEAIEDVHKVRQVDLDIERPDNLGGINLTMAKKRMLEEDKIDKEIFKQKIKQKHRSERLKRREENRLKSKRASNDNGEEFVVQLGSANDREELASDSGADTSDVEEPSLKKRKVLVKNEQSSDSEGEISNKSDKSFNSDENESDGIDWSMQDDEEMALHLLKNS